MTDRYAVFGNPIEHSKSPDIHTLFAKQTGQNIAYTKEKIPEGGFRRAVTQFFASGGKGLNVTVPFKLEAFELADQLTLRAQTAGAVNTLWVDSDGLIHGDNTDGLGLVSDIVDHQGWAIAGKRVLVLGAGGAVRGVLQPLLAHNPARLFVANRTASKAQLLAEQFSSFGPIAGGDYQSIDGAFDLIINGTSASMGGALPPIPTDALAEGCSAYDMMYGAEPTVFLLWAKRQGIQGLADGLGMLVGQAAESFKRWRGVSPDIGPVITAIRAKLEVSA